jgi:hypothetical protein
MLEWFKSRVFYWQIQQFFINRKETNTMTTNNQTKTFPFTDRESYIAWRAEWKATYKTNSQTIRDLKREIKELQRSGEHAGTQQSMREYLRVIQRNALIERAEAKVEAKRQYDERKAALKEAA